MRLIIRRLKAAHLAKRISLAARAQQEQDGVHRITIRHPRVVATQRGCGLRAGSNGSIRSPTSSARRLHCLSLPVTFQPLFSVSMGGLSAKIVAY